MSRPLAMDASIATAGAQLPAAETSPAAGQEMVTIAGLSNSFMPVSSSSHEEEQAPDYFSGRGPPMRRYVDFLSRCEVIATALTVD